MNLRSIALTLLLFFSASAAEAGLIIKGVDTTIQEGSTGFVDFTIESDSNDFIVFFESSSTIAPSTSGRRLEFAPTKVPSLGTTEYIFDGASVNQNTGLEFMPSPAGLNTTINFADGATVPIFTSAGTVKLFARLELTTLGPLAPEAGDAFDVTITPSSFAVGSGSDFSGSDFTARVQVVSSSIVIPEPSSVVIWALPGLVCAVRRTRK